MHLLIAANDFFPDPGSGGAGRYIHETSRGLVERGHNVSVITRNRDNLPQKERISGIDVYRHELVQSTDFFYSEIRSQIIKQIGANSVDILNLQGPLSSLVANQVIPEHIPRIYTFHSPWSEEYRVENTPVHRLNPWFNLNLKLRETIERLSVKRSAIVITLSEYMRQKVIEHHSPTAVQKVIPGGVDIDRFSPEGLDNIHSEEDQFDLLTIRRLVPRMGVETLLESFSKLLNDGVENCHLYVGGDGPLRKDLENRTIELGIESSVTFLGFIPEERLSQVYREMDLFILPTSSLEGFGLVTLEAMASGTPVLATSAGATPEVLAPLESSNSIPASLLVNTTKPGPLAQNIREWTMLSADDLKIASQKCREYVVEQYSWERTIDQLEALFTELSNDYANR